MKAWLGAALAFTLSLTIAAQEEKPVPKDSARVTVSGCVKGRRFVAIQRESPEPASAAVEIGRRFRLNGKKAMLEEMQEQREHLVEVTGIVRLSQLKESGIGLAGGRVRIGGGNPQEPIGSVGRDPNYTDATMDLESWRPLPDVCPIK